MSPVNKIPTTVKIIWEVVVGAAAILAAIFAYQGLDFQRDLAVKEASPFFKYSFSEEQKSFVVETEEDVSIHSVEWQFPYTEKSWFAKRKNSALLSLDDILFVLWSALKERGVFIIPPDFQGNSAGYLRCEVLTSFDEYKSAVETDAGYLLGALIEYSRKGEGPKVALDVLLIREFEDVSPQIRVIKSNASKSDLKLYMQKGMERFDAVISSYPYNESQQYIDASGRCHRSGKEFKQYFFDNKES